MAINREVLAVLAGARVAIDTTVDPVVAELVRAWSVAWTDIVAEWQAAADELTALSTDGRWPSRSQVARAERAQRALVVTRDQLDRLAEHTGVTVTGSVPRAVGEAAQAEARMVGAQLPPQAGGQVELAARFNRVSPEALDAIVTRSQRQVTALTRPLSREATAAMRASLVQGVIVGDNPRATAAQMVRRVRGDFAGGLTRAMVIARTETLDAHRQGAWAQDQANKDVLAGWAWTASLDARTCPSCWAKHGTRYPVSDPGPWDHQQGRCARVPVTLTWRDLGFDMDEPPSLLPDAEAVFNGLPEDQQLQVMGPARLDAYQSGRIAWSDLSRRRETPDWRPSYAPTPVRDLLAA